MELEFDDEDIEVGETIEVSIIHSIQQFLLSCESFPYDTCSCLLEVSDSSTSIIIIVRIKLENCVCHYARQCILQFKS
jgi:hypothetical protein